MRFLPDDLQNTGCQDCILWRCIRNASPHAKTQRSQLSLFSNAQHTQFNASLCSLPYENKYSYELLIPGAKAQRPHTSSSHCLTDLKLSAIMSKFCPAPCEPPPSCPPNQLTPASATPLFTGLGPPVSTSRLAPTTRVRTVILASSWRGSLRPSSNNSPAVSSHCFGTRDGCWATSARCCFEGAVRGGHGWDSGEEESTTNEGHHHISGNGLDSQTQPTDTDRGCSGEGQSG